MEGVRVPNCLIARRRRDEERREKTEKRGGEPWLYSFQETGVASRPRGLKRTRVIFDRPDWTIKIGQAPMVSTVRQKKALIEWAISKRVLGSFLSTARKGTPLS